MFIQSNLMKRVIMTTTFYSYGCNVIDATTILDFELIFWLLVVRLGYIGYLTTSLLVLKNHYVG